MENKIASVILRTLHSRLRETSLLDFLTDTTCSSPSGTSRSRDPVPRFTGTNELQSIANKPITALKRDLRISLMASTRPPFEFKSNGFRRPDLLAVAAPSSISKPTAVYPTWSANFAIRPTPEKYSITSILSFTPSPSSIQETSNTKKIMTWKATRLRNQHGLRLWFGKTWDGSSIKTGYPWTISIQASLGIRSANMRLKKISVSSGPIAKQRKPAGFCKYMDRAWSSSAANLAAGPTRYQQVIATWSTTCNSQEWSFSDLVHCEKGLNAPFPKPPIKSGGLGFWELAPKRSFARPTWPFFRPYIHGSHLAGSVAKLWWLHIKVEGRVGIKVGRSTKTMLNADDFFHGTLGPTSQTWHKQRVIPNQHWQVIAHRCT